jgi:hypothetical protein
MAPDYEKAFALLKPPVALAGDSVPPLPELCGSPAKYLPNSDVAVLNLRCAAGLPGAENLDAPEVLAWIDDLAWQAGLQTRGHLDEFIRNPAAYDHSLGKFCCQYLLRTIQELFGVRYNPARVADADFQNVLCDKPDFRNAHDLFIHGMMDGPGGTCASMPVLYVAAGRRRGYPLKLVEAPGHLFFRWDDPEGKCFNAPDVFNVEGTGHGISFHPDEYYRSRPREWTRAEKFSDWYLNSLSPAGELASFLATRGSCLEDNGRLEEAAQAFKWATQLVPDDFRYQGKLTALLKQSLEVGLQGLEAERRLLDVERMMFEQKARRLQAAPQLFNGPPHGGSHQCLHCGQVRQGPQQLQMPGHPPGCGCFNCQKTRPNPFSPW